MKKWNVAFFSPTAIVPFGQFEAETKALAVEKAKKSWKANFTPMSQGRYWIVDEVDEETTP